jgi:AcrR family transcriptional regulator
MSERHRSPDSDPEGDAPELQRRRRGAALIEAIHAGVLAELADFGFAELSIERVAARARTGKSAIYRRWPTKLELIVDTLANSFPDPDPPCSTGGLRTDLLQFHTTWARALSGPLGAALRANVGQHQRHPEIANALRARIIEPRQRILRELLVAGVDRGEVRADALTPECIDAGPALIRQRFIESGEPLDADAVERIVDNILIPMFRAPSVTGPADRASAPEREDTEERGSGSVA